MRFSGKDGFKSDISRANVNFPVPARIAEYPYQQIRTIGRVEKWIETTWLTY